ncbi:Permease of the drug/metabolite transporter (DMT) superfamily [Alloyangia pacifica]|uniref:Permease of the drug/metabolite transporter (DMT) superfamily n=2 Tax=Alloyangia pacifica TaxID=311180 RepID=A0A1I6P2N0_9RHOB|nr:Permease of the drug/metabolite transporter (DMT) superfamily [Alloyangia pacifica]SFS34340.1 Permease of the drug/metabolite transporter (DMT) superfamily [Alloyangia pacifica]
MSAPLAPGTAPGAVPRAALWMVGSIVSFSAMAVAGRYVSTGLDTFEIMLYRSLLGVVIISSIVTLTGKRRTVATRHIGTHIIRNISHFTGQNLWFYAITVIPLAQVFALEFTGPIWAMLLATLVLGERLTWPRSLAALVGFLGILIVTRPSPETLSPGLFAAAGAAIGFAGSAIFTRKLTRTDSTLCILFWLTLTQAVMGLVCAGFDGDIALPSAEAVPGVIVIGVAGLCAHYCLTTALGLAPASVVMPIDFTRLPVIAIVGMLLYAEPLDPWVLLGAALIFAANYANILRETRAARPSAG